MPLLIVIVVLVVMLPIWLVRRKSSGKRSKGASALGWAVLFLGSGRMPPPPPQSQIEEKMRSNKNREVSNKND